MSDVPSIPNISGLQLRSVEKRDYSWFFIFADSVSVVTEGSWRLIHDGRIAATSQDDGHRFGLPQPVDASAGVLTAVQGRVIHSSRLDISTGDLFLYFSSKSFLQFLQMSSGYEAWRLYVGNEQFICLGGGGITSFESHQAG